jgi:hypothetical protein
MKHGVYEGDLYYVEMPRFSSGSREVPIGSIYCTGNFLIPYVPEGDHVRVELRATRRLSEFVSTDDTSYFQGILRYPDLTPSHEEPPAPAAAEEQAVRVVPDVAPDDEGVNGKDDDSELSIEEVQLEHKVEELEVMNAVEVVNEENFGECLSVDEYVSRMFEMKSVGGAERLCPKTEAYYTDAVLSFPKSTASFLDSLPETETVVFKITADVDSTSAFCALARIHAWPSSSLTGATFLLNKGPVPWRKLKRTTMMNVRVSFNDRVPPRPLHSVPHTLVGSLHSDVGTFNVYAVSCHFPSPTQLANRFFTTLKKVVLQDTDNSFPPDFRAAIAVMSFGTIENKSSQIRVDVVTIKEVRV